MSPGRHDKIEVGRIDKGGFEDDIRPSKNACQVIIGTKVQFVYDELKKML